MDLRDLISAYPALSWRDRLHMIVRWRVCPLSKIAALVPDEGLIVDLGCGHGLFTQLLAQTHETHNVIGIDLDAHKIALAQQLKLPNLRFVAGDIADADLPEAAAIAILDVFYLIPFEVQEKLLTVCAKKLDAGGTIILKEMAERPPWKVFLNWLEETLAVRVLRITANTGSARFFFRSRAEWADIFHNLGFSVEIVPLDKGYYHPHVVFIARKLSA